MILGWQCKACRATCRTKLRRPEHCPHCGVVDELENRPACQVCGAVQTPDEPVCKCPAQLERCGSCIMGAHDQCDGFLAIRRNVNGKVIPSRVPGSGTASNPFGEFSAEYLSARKIPCGCRKCVVKSRDGGSDGRR